MKVTQLWPALCNPMNYTVHGILQARRLEWVTTHSSRGSSQPSNRTGASCIAGGFFTSWATREASEVTQFSTLCGSIYVFSSWPTRPSKSPGTTFLLHLGRDRRDHLLYLFLSLSGFPWGLFFILYMLLNKYIYIYTHTHTHTHTHIHTYTHTYIHTHVCVCVC